MPYFAALLSPWMRPNARIAWLPELMIGRLSDELACGLFDQRDIRFHLAQHQHFAFGCAADHDEGEFAARVGHIGKVHWLDSAHLVFQRTANRISMLGWLARFLAAQLPLSLNNALYAAL